ncbi:DUF456 domain-containing protein [Kineosporia rhizophila]|uniref:DUF456 domain-containing protein n=1 Tax=Kineosporia TaxID=49184 RepID=UPI000A60BDF3|nr:MULTISPECIES: DUF456 domain-containing protein [Kineosporia]MCE0537320.1 DUF456 domain-containing protein [Kineosporia rhizophila]GLY17536.1 hypothetical protein Kisp01_45500 [Kineosporia sp. NBRC 101677]
MSAVTVLAAALIVVGLAGVIVPVLPGLLVVAGGILLWAFAESSAAGWTVFGLAAAVLLLGTVVKYALPGRRLREGGVPWITLAFGALLGVIGFFLIPVIGLPIGFVAGIYLAELTRLGSHSPAWSSTLAAVRAVGLSMLIELASGLLAAAVWIAGVIWA